MDTKTTILTEAISQFTENGYHGTSLDSLLKATKLSKGGFFYYFKSKQDLAVQAINYYNTELLNYLKTVTATHDTPKQKISAWIKSIGQLIKKDNFNGLLLSTIASETSNHDPIRQATQEAYNQQAQRLLKQLQTLKDDKKTHADINHITSFIITSIEGITSTATIHRNEEKLDSDIQFTTTLLKALID